MTSGRYQSDSEVLREGFFLGELHKAEDAARFEVPRSAAQVGAANMETGRFHTFDTFRRLFSHA